jgi:acetylornithine deacetylase
MRVRVTGAGAHVKSANEAVNAIEKAMVLIQALNDYRKEINQRPKHPAFAHHPHPLNVNVGIIKGGDWPSNVPGECVFEARIGFYPGEDPANVQAEVSAYLLEAAKKDEWLAKVPPDICFYGFRAPGCELPKTLPLFQTLSRAHEKVYGEKLGWYSSTATTDIRQYWIYENIPASCYGPVGGNIHAPDEWVDLNSVKQCTKTYAAFILDWCGAK